MRIVLFLQGAGCTLKLIKNSIFCRQWDGYTIIGGIQINWDDGTQDTLGIQKGTRYRNALDTDLAGYLANPKTRFHRWARHQKNLLPISNIRHQQSLVRYRKSNCQTDCILVRYRIIPISTELNPISDKSDIQYQY
jgi:hypothetical protein